VIHCDNVLLSSALTRPNAQLTNLALTINVPTHAQSLECAELIPNAEFKVTYKYALAKLVSPEMLTWDVLRYLTVDQKRTVPLERDVKEASASLLVPAAENV